MRNNRSELLASLDANQENRIYGDCLIDLCTQDRVLETIDLRCAGSRRDNEIGIAARCQGRLHFSDALVGSEQLCSS